MKRTGTLEQSNALKLACPFTSALSEAGRINMKDLHQPCDRDYGLYIDNGAVNVIGIGTLIESLSALDEFVFRGREFTLEQDVYKRQLFMLFFPYIKKKLAARRAAA